MIVRPFTFITALLFALSGAYLFAVKHHSEMLDDQLSATTQATRQDEQAIRVLQAQWAQEADPSRLAELAAQFTGLQPMKPGQLVTLASLGSALPAAGSAAPGPNPEDEMPAMPAGVAVAQVAPAAAPAAVARNDAAPAVAAPVRTASAMPAHVRAEVVTHSALAARVAEADVAPAHVSHTAAPERMASVETLLHNLSGSHHAHMRHAEPSHIYAENAAAYAPQPVAPEQPMGAQVMSVRAVTQASAPPPPIDGGSMLGMAQNGGAN